MKRRILTILWPLLVGLPMAEPLAAQATLGRTTLTNSITATSEHIVLGSWAGITAPGVNKTTLTNILIDNEVFEALEIDAPGTNYIHVIRGVRKTLRTPHAAGAIVWAGPSNAFVDSEPTGTCTRTSLRAVPIIAIATRRFFDCGPASGVFFRTDAPDSSYYGTAIASGASATVAINAQTFKISGTSAITTFTDPAGWADGGCFNIIPTGNFTTVATGGNIGKASTAVTGRVMKVCKGLSGLWYPSY